MTRFDDQAVSTVLSYVITLAITTLLLTGLLFAVSGYVTDQRERVVQSELRVIGEQIASSIERADHLIANTPYNGQVRIEQTFPEVVAETRYTIEVDGTEEEIILRAGALDIVVTVDIVVDARGTDLADASIQGGSVVVSYDDSASNDIIVSSP